MQIQTKYSCGDRFFIRYSNEFRLVEVTAIDVTIRKCEYDPEDREIKIVYSLKGIIIQDDTVTYGSTYTVLEKECLSFEEASTLLSNDYAKASETLLTKYMHILKTLQPKENEE